MLRDCDPLALYAVGAQYTQVIYMVGSDVAAAAGLWLPCLFMA
jgi:hypothetical protein